MTYEKAVENVCLNRRFFVTKQGRFGLGPWSIKKGDIVCILLGGKTPFILRIHDDKASKRKGPDEVCGARLLYMDLCTMRTTWR
jgi:hypothetical protein